MCVLVPPLLLFFSTASKWPPQLLTGVGFNLRGIFVREFMTVRGSRHRMGVFASILLSFPPFPGLAPIVPTVCCNLFQSIMYFLNVTAIYILCDWLHSFLIARVLIGDVQAN